MRYVRMFLLYSQTALEYRSRSFIWFLIALFNPLLLLLFWKGAATKGGVLLGGWTVSSISSYYFLLIIAGSLLTAHVEEDISQLDIQQGGLSKYLVRPFSYYWMKFLEELPYRLLQGIFGVIVCILFVVLFKNVLIVTSDFFTLIASLFVICFAYFLSFTFKMIVGLLGFWFVDLGGFYQLVEITLLIFAGYLMPLEFFPNTLSHIASVLPFSYMIYFPVVAIIGKLSVLELLQAVSMQILWLFVFIAIYQVVWRLGRKKFTALGQ